MNADLHRLWNTIQELHNRAEAAEDRLEALETEVNALREHTHKTDLRTSDADPKSGTPCEWIPCGCSAFDDCSRCGGRGGAWESME
jgi:hypothetical protein